MESDQLGIIEKLPDKACSGNSIFFRDLYNFRYNWRNFEKLERRIRNESRCFKRRTVYFPIFVHFQLACVTTVTVDSYRRSSRDYV